MSTEKKTILLVEDHEDARFVLSAILNFDGYAVIEATDGRQGVRMARLHQPDLILMDIRMPRMNGFEAGDEIQRADDIATVPIVAVTAETMDPVQRRRADRLFHSIVQKPVEPDQLLERVRSIIGGP